MPFPIALAGAALGGASNMQTSAMGAVSTAVNNHVNYAYAKKLYDRQYRDNIAFWRMQNDYNSPEMQMERFKQAGLNPMLIYGQGNAGNASPIQSPDAPMVHSERLPLPDFGGFPMIASIYDLEMKQAQIDNLRAQNSVILQEGLLKSVQVEESVMRTERGKYDLEFESELRNVSAETRRERLRQMKVQTDNAIQENVRREILTAKSVEEAAERILNMKADRNIKRVQVPFIKADTERIKENILLMQKDGRLKELDIELRKMGLNPSDPTWTRVVSRFLLGGVDAYEGEGGMMESIYKRLFSPNK